MEVRQSKAWKGRKPRSSARTPRLSEVRNREKGTAARRRSKIAPIRPKAGTTFAKPAPDHTGIARVEHNLVGRNKRGKSWRILDGLNSSGFIQKPISLAARDRRPEHIVNARIPSEVDRSPEAWNPAEHGHHNQYGEAGCILPSGSLIPEHLRTIVDLSCLRLREGHLSGLR